MTEPGIIRLIIVDDHQHIHDLIAALTRDAADMRVVGEFYRGDEAVDNCARLKPDLVLMDVMMPGLNGMDTTRALIAQNPGLRVLGLSSFREYEYIKAMLDNGAAGYLVKDALADDLLSTIRAIHQGSVVFSREVAQTLLSPPTGSTVPQYGLTDREIEVLQLIAKGLTNVEIATALAITPPTVRFHTNNILYKLRVKTRSEALVLAAKHGLVK
jgi:DNA-binding NarL/FixJ family response regulator